MSIPHHLTTSHGNIEYRFNYRVGTLVIGYYPRRVSAGLPYRVLLLDHDGKIRSKIKLCHEALTELRKGVDALLALNIEDGD